MSNLHHPIRTSAAIICTTFLLLGMFTVIALPEEVVEDKDIHLLWTFGSLQKSEDGLTFEAITRDDVLNSGDQIKFFIEVKKPCFVYLIYQSSQGELSVLFPFRFDDPDQTLQATGQHFIPKGDQWYELDEHVGSETFFLLASSDPLRELEALINRYESADPSRRPQLAQTIIAEIRHLRKKHTRFKAEVTQPVNIIGSMRGTDASRPIDTQDLTQFAVEIAAKTFFSRSITIDHR